jgi:Protein of unknown function (DUF1367)
MISKGVFKVIDTEILLPYDDRARTIMQQLHDNDRVLVTVHRARNAEHNALAHAVFDRIADAVGLPQETIKLWLKWETGYVDIVQLPNGKHIASPRSFRFESMGQDEFQKFWDEAWVVIGEKILPQLPHEIFEEIRAIVGRKAA